MQNNFLKFFLVVALFFTLTTAAFAESWISRVMGSLLPSGNSWSASVFNLTSGDLTQRNLSNITVQKTDTPNLTGTSILTNASKASASSISIIPVDKWKLKCATIIGQQPQPQIEVLSPNGGEIYQAGQQVTVQWRSCNGDSDDAARIKITTINGSGAVSTLIVVPEQLKSYTISLPAMIGSVPVISGTYYKIAVDYVDNSGQSQTPGQVLATDISNNLFTIINNGGSNSGTSSSGTSSSATSTVPLLLKPLDASSAIGFGGNNGGAGSLSGSHLVSLKNTSNAPVWITCDALDIAPEFVGNHNGFSGSMMCTTSLGHLEPNLSNSLKLDPGQEVIYNESVIYTTPLSYNNLDVDFRTKITHIRYKPTQSSTNDIVITPQAHPQFQSAWNALLNSPWQNY